MTLRRLTSRFKLESSLLSLICVFTQCLNLNHGQAQLPADKVPLSQKIKAIEQDEHTENLMTMIKSGEVKYQAFKIIDSPPYYVFISIDDRVRSKNFDGMFLAGTADYIHELKIVGFGRQGDDHITGSIFDTHAPSNYTYQNVKYTVAREVKKEEADLVTGDQHVDTKSHTLNPSIGPPKQAIEALIHTLDLSCSQTNDGMIRSINVQKTAIDEEEAKTLLSNAKLYRPISATHIAYRLFRDSWGVYYFIEERKSPEKGELFRLWRGYRGSMSLIPTMTAASDSEGVVLISKDAAMRLVSSGGRPSAYKNNSGEEYGALWLQTESPTSDRQQKTLVEIPIAENQGVIYSELGIYDDYYLGSPCDPLYGRSPSFLERLLPPRYGTE